MDNSDKDTESKRKIQKIEVSTTTSKPQSSETNPNIAYHFSWQTSLQKDLEEERKTNAEIRASQTKTLKDNLLLSKEKDALKLKIKQLEDKLSKSDDFFPLKKKNEELLAENQRLRVELGKLSCLELPMEVEAIMVRPNVYQLRRVSSVSAQAQDKKQ